METPMGVSLGRNGRDDFRSIQTSDLCTFIADTPTQSSETSCPFPYQTSNGPTILVGVQDRFYPRLG